MPSVTIIIADNEVDGEPTYKLLHPACKSRQANRYFFSSDSITFIAYYSGIMGNDIKYEIHDATCPGNQWSVIVSDAHKKVIENLAAAIAQRFPDIESVVVQIC